MASSCSKSQLCVFLFFQFIICFFLVENTLFFVLYFWIAAFFPGMSMDKMLS